MVTPQRQPDATGRAERAMRLSVFEANCGRNFGWFVEKQGRKLAALTDPHFEDQFWYSYFVAPITKNPVECAALHTSIRPTPYERVLLWARRLRK